MSEHQPVNAEKEELRTLSSKATPGTWRQEFCRDGELLPDGTGSMDDYETPVGTVFVLDEQSAEGHCLTEFDAGSANDAAFIVAAVNYVRTHVIPPAECADFGCDGKGRQVQGWTDKNGYPEDQYGECSRPCGRGIAPAADQGASDV